MFSAYRDLLAQGHGPAHSRDWRWRLACGCMIAVAWTSGCRREDRDFRAGGPRDGNGPVHPGEDRGPQTNWETNAFALSEGKRLYQSFNCVGCHGNGGGDIGPALMDAKWLYGAKPAEVFESIMAGRPNGMPAFRDKITDPQAWQLAAYVRSLSGQARHAAATSRDDHAKASPPENSLDRENPKRAPDPAPTSR